MNVHEGNCRVVSLFLRSATEVRGALSLAPLALRLVTKGGTLIENATSKTLCSSGSALPWMFPLLFFQFWEIDKPVP